MTNKQPRRTLREIVRDTALELELPAYVVYDMPHIELDGDRRILFERHHGILEYNDTRICIAARDTVVCIDGSGLRLCAMNATELSVAGEIESIVFEKRKSGG